MPDTTPDNILIFTKPPPEEYAFPVPLPIAGQYEITRGSGFHITLAVRPAAWTRFWTRVLLGWHWTDIEIVRDFP